MPQQIRTNKFAPPWKFRRDFDAAEQSGAAQTVTIDILRRRAEFRLRPPTSLEQFFDDLRDQTVKRLACGAANSGRPCWSPSSVEQKNVAPPEKVGGATLGGSDSLLRHHLVLSPERCIRRWTSPPAKKNAARMETILCSPVSRTHLVLGKFFTVLTASLTSAVLAVTSMGFSFYYGQNIFNSGLDAGQTPMHLQIGLRAAMAVLLMGLPLSMFFSALLLAVSLFAKSFREADSYKTPLTFVIVIPAVVSMLPGIDLNARTALIPVLGTSLVGKELVSGTYHWGYIAMIFGMSCVYAAVAIAVTIVLFNREEVLFRV